MESSTSDLQKNNEFEAIYNPVVRQCNVTFEYFSRINEEPDDIKQQLSSMELASNTTFKETRSDLTTIDAP